MVALQNTGRVARKDFSFYRNERTDLGACIPDNRFHLLLGDRAWFSLPATTRARFGRKAVGGRTITYLGEVTTYATNTAGRILGQLARLIGGPLPIHADLGTAAAVTVTEDEAEGGQIWTRQYGRHRGFPQVIHSVKRFAGATGLEEYLGFGFGIALGLRAEGGTLWFESDHYFWRLGGRRMRLPRWLAPGALSIGHIDHGDGWFTFTLDLAHPLFGRMIHQQCRFTEAEIGTVQ